MRSKKLWCSSSKAIVVTNNSAGEVENVNIVEDEEALNGKEEIHDDVDKEEVTWTQKMDDQAIEYIMSTRLRCSLERDEVVVRIGRNIVHRDFCKKSFSSRGWVSDIVIDVFCHILNLYNVVTDSDSKFILKTSFARMLLKNLGSDVDQKEIISARDHVMKHAYDNGFNIRQCLNLMVPVLYCDHWCLYTFALQDRKILVFDSLHKVEQDYHDICKRKVPGAVQNVLKLVDPTWSVDLTRWEVLQEEIPTQPDCYSCGVFLLLSILSWDGYWKCNLPCDSNQLQEYRNMLLLYMLRHPLNECRCDLIDKFTLTFESNRKRVKKKCRTNICDALS